jgi:hypothetical protein
MPLNHDSRHESSQPESALAVSFPTFPPDALEAAFLELAPALAAVAPQAFPQPYPAQRVVAALDSLADALAKGAAMGGALNFWSVVGLRRDEVRNAQALASLWTTDFGGTVSRRFLAAFLGEAIVEVDWSEELASGYRVETECNPLGAGSDRIDVVVESANHVVGIEIKIGAGLGPNQLDRYIAAIEIRAAWMHSTAHVVLLAPFDSESDKVRTVRWSAVSDAALRAVRGGQSQRSTVEELIVSFGDHVRTF